jgi:thiol-disulfide isomerase/thioredoxin
MVDQAVEARLAKLKAELIAELGKGGGGAAVAMINVEYKILDIDGKPVPDKEFAIVKMDRKTQSQTVLAEGKTDANGLIKVDQKISATESALLVVDGEARVRVLGRKAVDGLIKDEVVLTPPPPKVGDQAPDIALIDPATQAKVKLSEYKGQVVFLDFWTTWCPPCQGVMKHNDEIMRKNDAAWKGKAVILGISCDDKGETLVEHIKKTGWTGLPQLWAPPDAKGNQLAPTLYGISGFPTGFLIDQNGKVVWTGHPATTDVEAEINKLLAPKS